MRIKISFLLLLVFFQSFYAVSYSNGGADSISKRQSIIFIGDTQRTSLLEFWRERNAGVAKRMFSEVASENPAAVMHLGDMVFNGTDQNSWHDFETDAADLFARHIPFHPTLGNHEYFLGHQVPSYVIEHFPDLRGPTWYSLTFGKIAVILLNSNLSSLTKRQVADQQTWYEQTLQKYQADSAVAWIIVGCHHPPYTNSSLVSDSKGVQQHFVQPFVTTKKAKLFICGHAHGYEHFVNYGKDFVVSAGGGGARPKLGKNNRDAFHRDIYKAGRTRDFNYCKLTQTQEGLLFELRAWDGKNGNFYTGESILIK